MQETKRNKEDCYKEERRILRSSMLNNKLVVFVGAGASIPSGMPSWKEASDIIVSKLNVQDSSSLDSLKIPQYYYNSRGKKEYIDLIHDIFRDGDDLEINDIHRNIVKLHAHTVITTNYDCLLEKAFDENADFINVISQDKDLPYKSSEKELIKMHGDFKYDNFVLREDDYLNYSENFKLLETYIKSLIATNTVLFVGYSFSDPDVKQIFAWVKEILKDDLQRAYMIEALKEYDPLEFEYYRNLGINVLYMSNFYQGFDKKYAADYVNDFLKSIMEEEPCKDNIEYIYRNLRPYEDLNYIYEKDIRKAFEPYGITVINKAICPLKQAKGSQELFDEIFYNQATDHQNEILLIRSAVKKSSIEKIGFENSLPNERISPPNYMEYLYNFDFVALKQLREENEFNLTDDTPELYLEQGFISYNLHEYEKAYLYARKASSLFFHKKQYVWYLLSEINRRNLGNIIRQDWQDNSTGKEKIIEECSGIDIYKIMDSVPFEDSESKNFLNGIFSFRTYYEYFQDIYSKSKKANKEATTNFTLYAGIPTYDQMRDQVKECYFYDAYNFVMTDRYTEEMEIYRLFTRTLIEAICCSSKFYYDSEVGKESLSGNITPPYLDEFDIFIILRYTQQKELSELLVRKCNNIIEISETSKIYLHKIVKNLSTLQGEGLNVFWVYLTLAGYIKLDSDISDETFSAIIFLINGANVSKYCKDILKFIKNVDQQDLFKQGKLVEKLGELVESIMDQILQNKINDYYSMLIQQSLIIYKKTKDYYFSESMLKYVSTHSSAEDLSLMINIYPLCEKKIKDCIRKETKKWKWEYSIESILIYEELVLNDFLDSDKNIEEEILNNMKDLNRGTNDLMPRTFEEVISVLTNLYLNNKVCLKGKIYETIQNSGVGYCQWLIAMNSFNYENFNIEWLNKCTKNLLQTISNTSESKTGISKKIKEAFQNGCRDENILEIYFEYFV